MKFWYFGKHLFTFDIVAALVVATCFTGVALRGERPILELLCKDGTALYGAFLAALTALLGFAIAAVAIIAGLVSSPSFKDLRRSGEYDNFWGAFTWSIRALAIGSGLSLLALFIGRYDAARFWMLVIVVFGIALAALSLIRSGHTLEVVLKKARDSGEPATETMTHYPPA